MHLIIRNNLSLLFYVSTYIDGFILYFYFLFSKIQKIYFAKKNNTFIATLSLISFGGVALGIFD